MAEISQDIRAGVLRDIQAERSLRQRRKRLQYGLSDPKLRGTAYKELLEEEEDPETGITGKERGALATKKGSDLAEKYGEAGRLVGMYKNLQGQFKRVDEDFPGGTGAKAYWTHKAAALPFAPAWLQKQSVPLEGASAQRQETKIAAMPIISGQARFVVSLAKLMDLIIPELHREPANRDELMTQSVRNSMTLVFGVMNGYFTAENLAKRGVNPDQEIQSEEEALQILGDIQISPGQEKAIQEAISDVINTPALRDVERARAGASTDEEDKEYQEYLKIVGE